MNKILPSLCLFLALSSICLLAQTATPSQAVSTATVRHVSVSGGYPIGSKEAPVTVEELCYYLNEFHSEHASRDQTWVDWCTYCSQVQKDISTYGLNDGSIITTSSGWWFKTVPILCTEKLAFFDTSADLKKSNTAIDYFVYSVKLDYSHVIIDSVSSSQLQKEFNQWKSKNPTLEELATYINNQIKNPEEAPAIQAAMRETYPASDTLVQADRCAEMIQQGEVKEGWTMNEGTFVCFNDTLKKVTSAPGTEMATCVAGNTLDGNYERPSTLSLPASEL